MMDNDISIRKITGGDLEAVEDLLQQEADHNGHDFDEDSPYHPVNVAMATVNASISADDVDCGWLAFCGDAPAGIITTPDGLAGGVFVGDDFRNKGIAGALVRERESYFFEERELPEVKRPIRADNTASLNLHLDKLGYRLSGESRKMLDDNPDLPGETVLHVEKTAAEYFSAKQQGRDSGGDKPSYRPNDPAPPAM